MVLPLQVTNILLSGLDLMQLEEPIRNPPGALGDKPAASVMSASADEGQDNETDDSDTQIQATCDDIAVQAGGAIRDTDSISSYYTTRVVSSTRLLKTFTLR